MKNILIVTIVLILIATVAALALGGKSGDRNATGHISGLTASESMCSVKGRTENGSLWLGYTVRWKDGYELDYKPLNVEGNFSEILTFQLRPQGLEEVIVCLWRYKVSASQCAKDNGGQACEWCKRNGCHMEDRIDCMTGN